MKKTVLVTPADVLRIGLGEGVYALGLVTHISKNRDAALVSYAKKPFSEPYNEAELMKALADDSIRLLHSLRGFQNGQDWEIVARNASIPPDLAPMPIFQAADLYLVMDQKCPCTVVKYLKTIPTGASPMKRSVAGCVYVDQYLKKVLIDDPMKLPNGSLED